MVEAIEQCLERHKIHKVRINQTVGLCHKASRGCSPKVYRSDAKIMVLFAGDGIFLEGEVGWGGEEGVQCCGIARVELHLT